MPAFSLSTRWRGLLVAGITQVTAGRLMMYLSENWAQPV